jgi:hypothetical protein
MFVFTEKFFPDSSSQREATVDIRKMKEVAQEPATPAEVLETVPDGVNLEAYKRCMKYCKAQGVNLDTFKFVRIGLEKLRIMPKKLVGKSSLELADTSVSMIYKVGSF